MPTISIDPADFNQLIQNELDPESLARQLDLVKGEYKGLDEEGNWRVELNDTNRPDLWSAEGIARQISMAQGRRRDYSFFSGAEEGRIQVEPEVQKLRPYVGAFLVRNLKMTKVALAQLIQTQEKLSENYGHRRRDLAIGVYHASKISFPVHYRLVLPKEYRYTPLGFDQPMTLADILEKHPKGIEYRSILAGQPKVPLLVDDSGMILSMPPIINSRELGEVQPGDSDLFVEATGTELSLVCMALNILACDLADRGGKISRVKTVYPFDTSEGREVCAPCQIKRSICIPAVEFSRLLGVEVKPSEVDNVLERYGCEVKVDGNQYLVQPHPTRSDYLHWADVVEDFAIARGYETFAPQMPQDFSIGKSDGLSELENKVRDQMIGMGYEEMISNILVSRDQLCRKMNQPEKKVVEVSNVMNENYAAVRDSILTSLLSTESSSSGAAYPHRLFEAGDVAVFDEKAEHGSNTELHLAGILTHREATLAEIHSDLDFLFAQLKLELCLKEFQHDSFLPGRFAQICWQDRPVGILGEVHPIVLSAWDIQMPLVAFEINLNALL